MTQHPVPHRAPLSHPRCQRGVVLIFALIMLVVLSMLVSVSVKSTMSTELATNNSRTQSLAMQAAEAALRHCETRALNAVADVPVNPQIVPVAAPNPSTNPYRWESLTNWDGTGTGVNVTVLSSGDVNNDTTREMYKRFPECMVQYLQAGNNKRLVVTARGFGPDVTPVDANRTAPKGSEVWLQSTLTSN